MSGIVEKYNKLKENAYFIKFKAGGRFTIYALGIYLAATFTIGCLGLIIGSTFLTLPLAMLIFHPVAWILMGIVLTATYKMVIEPLFHLIKGYVDGKEASKGEKSPKEQKFTRCKSLDSGLDTISRKTDDLDKRVRRNSYSPSTDSGIVPGSKPASSNNSRRNSNASGDSGLGVNSAKDKQYKVVTYNTTGDGNCFFHAVFGDNSSSLCKAERAQDMRMEWHKFLSQFHSLNDPKMPELLKEQMQKVFGAFLENPNHLIGRSDSIKDLVQYTNRRVEKIKKKTKKLIKKLCCLTTLEEDEVISDLRSISVSNLNISERKYDRNYNSDTTANSFLNGKSIYRSYLEAINSQSYYVFIEEIPILASLANIEIDVHYKNNNNDVHTVFKPNPVTINEGYQRNNELWGDKRQETIYLKPGHYERAKVVEAEPSLMEKANSALQGAAAACANALSLNT
ncbi:uncharacterized protein TNCT_5851 [Trichonephila clavata]|uniref:OTU domain-containing protein n=1 Tax=Trichonephila clavata TaxID=2740835 RepID=A0A8X6LI00_TRICU|nr:uncharacterized protein TNCT_5851 [Trichonephila clavata]